MPVRESEILKRVRLALSEAGTVNFRNQVGALRDTYGQLVRFGLCNGSSDVIGWTSRVVTQEMVGKKVAIFTAIETKRSVGGVRSEDQKNFVGTVQAAGGIAGFASSESEAVQIVKRWKP